MNPFAIALWLFASAIGFACGGMSGAAIGLAIGTGISILVDLF